MSSDTDVALQIAPDTGKPNGNRISKYEGRVTGGYDSDDTGVRLRKACVEGAGESRRLIDRQYKPASLQEVHRR